MALRAGICCSLKDPEKNGSIEVTRADVYGIRNTQKATLPGYSFLLQLSQTIICFWLSQCLVFSFHLRKSISQLNVTLVIFRIATAVDSNDRSIPIGPVFWIAQYSTSFVVFEHPVKKPSVGPYQLLFARYLALHQTQQI